MENILKNGERRHVTVIFTDMKDFTKITENLDPEDIDYLMSKIFNIFETIIKQNEGFVEKYIGDAMVAVFGAKNIHEDDTQRAINSALEIQNSIQKLNNEFNNININFRTGINTGLVTIGKRGEYDVVTGHTLAIASRLESIAPEQSIIVSENTKKKCESSYIFTKYKNLKLKGKNQEISSYLVTGETYSLFKYNYPFIGRKKELSKMLKLYMRFDGEEDLSIYITGQTGIGKTRLISHFFEKIKEFPNFNNTIMYVRGSSVANHDYYLIFNLILSYFSINRRDNEAKIKSKLLNNNIKEEYIDFIIDFFNNKNINEEKKIFTILYNIINQILDFENSVLYKPIICIDNISRADKKSFDFLRFYINKIEIKPFFIICSRKEVQKVYQIFNGISHIKLENFSKSESIRYINQVSENSVDINIQDQIINQTKGNPLFLEEYIEYINKYGFNSEIPSTVQNIILASIDKLDSGVKEFIQKCSVFQRPFLRADARYIHTHTKGKVQDIKYFLNILEEESILLKRNNFYRFRQSLYREVIYNSILKQNRKILHKLVGLQLLKRKNSNLSTTVFHLNKAGLFQKSATLILNFEESLTIDFIPFIDDIISSKDKISKKDLVDLLFLKYSILYNNGRLNKILEIVDYLFDIAVDNDDIEIYAYGYHLLSSYYFAAFNYELSSYNGKKAIYYYSLLDNESSHFSNVVRFVSLSNLSLNIFTDKYINLLKKEDINYKIINANFVFYSGKYSQGLKLIKDIYNEIVDKEIAINYLIDFLYEIGDFKSIINYGLDFIKNNTPNYRYYSKIYSFIGISMCNLGDKEKGLEYIEKGEDYSFQLNNLFYKTRVLAFLAEGYYLADKYKKAKEFLNQGLKNAIKTSDFESIYELYIIKLLIGSGMNDLNQIDFCLKELNQFNSDYLKSKFSYRSLYWFLMYRFSDKNNYESFDYLKKAYEIVMNKLNKIDQKEQKENFLNIRFNKQIIDEYHLYL